MMMRKIMVMLLACGLLGVAQATPVEGEAPPDFLGKTPEGVEIRVSEHHGKVLVVGFWASWCGYCRKQFPVLNYLQEEVGTDDLRVVVINFKEDAHTYRNVRRQLRASKVTWTHDRDGKISEAYDVSSVPQLFLIDRNGELAYKRSGYSEKSLPQLFDDVNELLAEPVPVATPVEPPEAVATD